MEPLVPPLKKSRPDFLSNGSSLPSSFPFPAPAGDKRFPPSDGFFSERDFNATSVGSKSKACLKFFSTSGCPYGEGCHFSHYVPGGVASVGLPQASSLTGSGALGSRKEPPAKSGLPMAPPMMSVRSREQGYAPSGFKSRLCSNFETSEGCRFGSKCHFAHGEHELRRPPKNTPDSNVKSLDRFQPPPPLGSVGTGPLEDKLAFTRHREPTPPGLAAAASFGAVSTAKVSIDASLAGIIIGKGGVNAKTISRATGAKLFIRDHETDSTLKNVEMEGSLDQIKFASSMVRELLANKDMLPPVKSGLAPQTYKSKLCENFPKGTCKYGDRCHFAHSQGELQQPAPS